MGWRIRFDAPGHFAMTLVTTSLDFAAAVPLPQASLVPGGVYILPIQSTSAQAPVVTLEGQRAMVLRSDGHWTAVVGLPLSEKPGHVTVLVRDGATPEKPGGIRHHRQTVRHAVAEGGAG